MRFCVSISAARPLLGPLDHILRRRDRDRQRPLRLLQPRDPALQRQRALDDALERRDLREGVEERLQRGVVVRGGGSGLAHGVTFVRKSARTVMEVSASPNTSVGRIWRPTGSTTRNLRCSWSTPASDSPRWLPPSSFVVSRPTWA